MCMCVYTYTCKLWHFLVLPITWEPVIELTQVVRNGSKCLYLSRGGWGGDVWVPTESWGDRCVGSREERLPLTLHSVPTRVGHAQTEWCPHPHWWWHIFLIYPTDARADLGRDTFSNITWKGIISAICCCLV